MTTRALLIPVEGPVTELDLDDGEDSLRVLQAAVGGWIEAVRLPRFIRGAGRATAYVNEEGKLERLPINRRATDFMIPGIGLFPGDYIAGPMVVAGFDPASGTHLPTLPPAVERRIRKIEDEAGGDYDAHRLT